MIIILHLFFLYPLINFKKYIKLNKSNILLGICVIIIAIFLPYWPYNISRKSLIFYGILIFFILFIFEKYHENNKLIELCNNLDDKNIKFVHSNSNADYINEKYEKFNINKIQCKRSINSKKPGSKEMEVIIYN